MTSQAQNSINLYKGNNPATIEKMLMIQKESVVNELKSYFDAKDNKELAIKLSMGQ